MLRKQNAVVPRPRDVVDREIRRRRGLDLLVGRKVFFYNEMSRTCSPA